MEDKLDFIEPLIQRAEEYGKTSLQLIKLKTVDKAAGLISTFSWKGLVFIIFFTSIIFASIGMAFWLSDLFGKPYCGLFLMAGFYFLLGCIIQIFMRNRIKKRISNSVISQMLN